MNTSLPAGAREILRRLTAAGHEAYLVGGCVRDLLLGAAPHDWDICTSALPRETEAVFAGAHLVETGLKHGTVTVFMDHAPYEVTTYRADGVYTDGRRPDSVRFVSRLSEDLARRDFTINAIAMDLEGRLQDPFDGQRDLRARLIRCVGDPEARFSEDGLRIMRALRFSAVLDFPIEARTAQAVRRCRAMLGRVAAERIRVELEKLLTGPRAAQVLRQYPDVLLEFWPQLAPLLSLEQNTPWHCYGGWEHTLHALDAAPPQRVVRLAVLLHDIGKPSCRQTDPQGVDHFYGHPEAGAAIADEMLRALRFDNATRQRVVTLVRYHDLPIQDTPKSVRRTLAKLGEEAFFQLLEVKRADAMGQSHRETPCRLAALLRIRALAQEMIAQKECFSLKDLAIDGRDVIAAGIPPGPQVGKVLQALLSQVVSGELPNRRYLLLSRIAQDAPPSAEEP